MFFTFLAKEVINKPETDADWTIKRGELLLLIVPSIAVVIVVVSQFCWLVCGACPAPRLFFSAASAAISPHLPLLPSNNSPALWTNQVITPNTMSSCRVSVCASLCASVCVCGSHMVRINSFSIFYIFHWAASRHQAGQQSFFMRFPWTFRGRFMYLMDFPQLCCFLFFLFVVLVIVVIVVLASCAKFAFFLCDTATTGSSSSNIADDDVALCPLAKFCDASIYNDSSVHFDY